MATLDDVRRHALALPRTDEAVSWGTAHWRVSKKGFVWERPLRRGDLDALAARGEPAPDGVVLGVRVARPRREGGADRRRSGRLLHGPALRRLPGRPGAPRPARRRRAPRARRRGLARPRTEDRRQGVARRAGRRIGRRPTPRAARRADGRPNRRGSSARRARRGRRGPPGSWGSVRRSPVQSIGASGATRTTAGATARYSAALIIFARTADDILGSPPSTTAPMSSGHEPNFEITWAAVFSPMPATPGSPSEGSPRSIAISA